MRRIAIVTVVVLACAQSPAVASAAPAPPAQTVIVELGATLPAATTEAALPARRAAAFRAEAPVATAVSQVGGTVRRRLGLIDALVATVTPAEAAALRARPDVEAVVSDTPIQRLPQLTAQAASRDTAPSARKHSQLCPTDPAVPELDPEALGVIRAASNDPAEPTAQQLATGAGVTVGVIADGIDPNNPDLIRADGSHVIGDYQDFTGQGTDVPTTTLEASLDVDSIAAQGRQVFDLSQQGFYFATPGCTARILGVAPGATVDVARIFPTGTFATQASTVEAIDYLVETDHVNVLNESFGDQEYPYDRFDPTVEADEAAIRAGVSVFAASGDSGLGNTIGSPAEAPGVIGVGATSTLRAIQQSGASGSDGPWLDDQIATLSSSGIAPSGKTLDVVAPGAYGLSSCTPTPRYLDCPQSAFRSGIALSGGTSESSPLAAGVAALVVQAFRAHHGGRTPTPDVVRQILTGTADDLGAPAAQQGAGRIDALRAVREAIAWGGTRGAVTPVSTQLDLTADAGRAARGTLRLASHASTAHVVAVLGEAERRVGGADLDVTLPLTAHGNGDGLFPIPVPAGVDRVAVDVTWPDPTESTFILPDLREPDGTLAADDSFPAGADNNEYLTVTHPPAGDWSLELFSPGYFGPPNPWLGAVHIHVDYLRDVRVGHVRVLRIPGRASRSARFELPATATALDGTAELRVDDLTERTTSIVPVAVRQSVRLRGAFSGSLGGDNGRPDGALTSQTYLLDVPAGIPALGVHLAVPAEPGLHVLGYLTNPEGVAVDRETDLHDTTPQRSIDLAAVAPMPGQWRITVGVTRIFPGTSTTVPFTGTVSTSRPDVTATGLPRHTRLPKGASTTAVVHIVNTTSATHDYIADPRLDGLGPVPLQVPRGLVVPRTATTPVGLPTVPPLTRAVTAVAHGSVPLRLEIEPNSLLEAMGPAVPSVVDSSATSTAAVTVSGDTLTVGQWLAVPDVSGVQPRGGTPASPVSLSVTATTAPFAPGITSTTGDPWAGMSSTPLTLAPGQSGDITVRFASVTSLSGVIAVETYDRDNSLASTLALLPWSYRTR